MNRAHWSLSWTTTVRCVNNTKTHTISCQELHAHPIARPQTQVPLSTLVPLKPLQKFLRIAVKVAAAVLEVHQQFIIHKVLNLLNAMTRDHAICSDFSFLPPTGYQTLQHSCPSRHRGCPHHRLWYRGSGVQRETLRL